MKFSKRFSLKKLKQSKKESENTVNIDCDLSTFSDAHNDESGWNFVKPLLEKYFSTEFAEFLCIPLLSVSNSFQPCSIFLTIPDQWKSELPNTDKDDGFVKVCFPIGLLKNFVIRQSKQRGLTFNPQVVRLEEENLPENLNLVLCDMKNRRRITLKATNLTMLTVDIISQQEDFTFLLNLEALGRICPSLSVALRKGDSEVEMSRRDKFIPFIDHRRGPDSKTKLKAKCKLTGGSQEIPRFPEINIVTDVIVADDLKMNFFVEEILRFLDFTSKKTLLYRFESFEVNDKNEVLLDKPLKRNGKCFKWIHAPKLFNLPKPAVIY